MYASHTAGTWLRYRVYWSQMFSITECSKGVLIVNFEHISRFFFPVSTVGFERLNISWILISCTVFNNPFQSKVFPCFWSFSILQLDHDCSLRTVTFQSSVNLNLCTGLVVLSDIIFWLKKKHSLKLLQYFKCAFNICLIFCF